MPSGSEIERKTLTFTYESIRDGGSKRERLLKIELDGTSLNGRLIGLIPLISNGNYGEIPSVEELRKMYDLNYEYIN
jgi:hypothetical protein